MKFNLSWAGGLLGVLLLSVSLAACGGSTTPAESEPDQTESAAPTEAPAETSPTEAPAAAATEAVVEEEEAAAADVAPSAPVASQASCFPIDIPTNTLIAAVSDEEWSRGPADAPVTVIEYGDFQ